MKRTDSWAGKCVGLLHRIVDWVFGYDFFISYAHSDGVNYPARLKEKLDQSGFKVFLDKSVYVAGDDLRRATRRRVSMSRKLVVIARPAALASEWVHREVDVHLAADRTPIVVNINEIVEKSRDDLALAATIHDRDWLRIEEEIVGQDNDPTDYCVGELIRSFDATRQETKRLRFFIGAAVVLVLLTLSSVLATCVAIKNARVANRERDTAMARLLATESAAALESKPELGLLLAVQAVRTTYEKRQFWLPSAEQALRKALSSTGGTPLHVAEGDVRSVAVSPGAPQLAVADDQGMLHLWDTSALQNTPTTFRVSDKPVTCMSYSPDGKLLATAAGDAQLKLWNPESIDKGVQEVIESEAGSIRLFSFSPDSRWLVTNAQRSLRFWGIGEGSVNLRIPLPESYAGFRLLGFSPDGQWLAIEGEREHVTLLNFATRKAFRIDTGLWSISTTGIAFSQDSKSIALGTAAGSVDVQALDDLTETEQIYTATELSPRLGGFVSALAFSPTENRLAAGSGGLDRTILVWDTDEHDLSPTALRGHTDGIRSLAFSPDGRLLASGSDDHKVRLWNIRGLNDQPIILRGHEEAVQDVVFSHDGGQLITLGTDWTVRVWSVSSPLAAPTVFASHESRVNAVAISPDLRFVASGSNSGVVRLWNVERQREEACLYECNRDTIYAIDFSPDGKWVVVGMRGDTPGLWHVDEPEEKRPVLLSGYGPQNKVDLVLFSPDGKWVVARDDHQIARLWSIDEDDMTLVDSDWSEESVQVVSFSDRGDYLGIGRSDGVIELWNTQKLQETSIEFCGHDGAVRHLSFHPTGGLLATAGDDRAVRLWDIHNPKREPTVLQADNGDLLLVTFTRNGDLLAVIASDLKLQVVRKRGRVFQEILAGEVPAPPGQAELGTDGKTLAVVSDRIVHVWNLDSPEAPPLMLEGHANSIGAVDLSRDGKWVVTGGADNDVRVWSLSIEDLMDIACSVAGRDMSSAERERFNMDAPD